MEYKEYIKLMKRQFETQDSRERVYQDNIIRPFLQSVFSDLDIEPVDIKIKSEIHEYEQYCGTYEKKYTDKNGKEIIKIIPATPDLCIADQWRWNNRDVEVIYRGVAEIKSPVLAPITGLEPKSYHCLPEIERHLNALRNKKVILTDGITWVFYRKDNGLIPVCDPICLGELLCEYTVSDYNNRIPVRSKGGRPIIVGFKFFEETYFSELKMKLIEFI